MRLKYMASLVGAGALALATAGPALAGSKSVPFKSAGSGSETSLSAPGCQATLAGCAVQSDGIATSSHLGTGAYTSVLTIHWASATSNGSGGFCAPADGTATLTAANGDTLDQTQTGTVCEVGATGYGVPHTFVGTFTNVGGTGRFTAATGGGDLSGGDDGAGNSHYSETGTIAY